MKITYTNKDKDTFKSNNLKEIIEYFYKNGIGTCDINVDYINESGKNSIITIMLESNGYEKLFSYAEEEEGIYAEYTSYGEYLDIKDCIFGELGDNIKFLNNIIV